MARTISTNHNLPDIHDEGKIKRYGLAIAIAALIIALLLFIVWAANYSSQINFGSH
jgi:hypothetical protein